MTPPPRALFVLYTQDQPRAVAFYRAALARDPTLDVPGMAQFPVAEGADLGLMPEAGIARLTGGLVDPAISGVRPPRAEVYLLVEDPRAAFERALAAGGVSISPVQPRDWGDEAGYLFDRDGHVVAFAGSLDR